MTSKGALVANRRLIGPSRQAPPHFYDRSAVVFILTHNSFIYHT